MRWVVASIVVHALVIALFVGARSSSSPPTRTPATSTPVAAIRIDVPTDVVFVDEPAVKGGGAVGGSRSSTSHTSARRASDTPRRSADAWEQVSMRMDDSLAGFGEGKGTGKGTGSGIGFGDGGGVRVADEIPVVPPPPEVSKARPAKLIWPTRDEDVDDDANLFVARITVDEDGDVVGAHMIKTRPGSRAERAANAIWQFRYAPALDDRGVPTRSTFDQPFQVR